MIQHYIIIDLRHYIRKNTFQKFCLCWCCTLILNETINGQSVMGEQSRMLRNSEAFDVYSISVNSVIEIEKKRLVNTILTTCTHAGWLLCLSIEKNGNVRATLNQIITRLFGQAGLVFLIHLNIDSFILVNNFLLIFYLLQWYSISHNFSLIYIGRQ